MDRGFRRRLYVSLLLAALVAGVCATAAQAVEMNMQYAPGTVVGTYGIERAYSTAAGSQNQAVVYGNWVAYCDHSVDTGDIKLFNRGGLVNSAITIAGATGKQFEPRIYGNRVAWTDESSGAGDVYWYDIAKKTTRRLTTSTDYEGYVDLNNDYLVYERYVGGGGTADIFLYNFKTGSTTRITNDSSNQWWPKISGDKIVWQDDRYGNWEIMWYDIKTKTTARVTNNATADTMPVIDGYRVAWEHNNGVDSDIQFSMYVGATGPSHVYTNIPSNGEQFNPCWKNDTLVWASNSDGDYDIWYMQNPTTWYGQISNAAGDQTQPAIWGGNVVYTDSRDGNLNIYATEIIRPTLTISAPSTTGYGAQTRVTGTLKRQDGSALTGRSVKLWYSPTALLPSTWATWSGSKVVTTDSSGKYSTLLPAQATRFVIQAEFQGDTSDVWYQASGVKTVLPKVALGKPSGPKSIGRSKYFTTAGLLDPAETGSGKVYIKAYRYSSGKYRLKKTLSTTLSAYDADTTRYAKKFKFGTAGKWKIRAYYPATSLNAASYSTWRYIKAK